MESLSDLEGWRVRKSLQGLARGIHVFDGNARELLVLLGEFQTEHGTPATFDLTKPEGFEGYLNETQRLLHNYLAAAESLRNHVEYVARTWLPPIHDDPDSAEYARRVKDTFRDPLGRFGRELRHHFLKQQILEAGGYLLWSDDPSDRKSGITINGADLLAEREIDYATARQYLQEIGDDILINDFVIEHSARIKGFYDWFGDAVRRRNRDALDEYERRDREIRDAWGPPVEDPSDVPPMET